MSDFFRFPHTPHAAWLSRESVREDKILSSLEVKQLFDGEVTVEEKVDGANIGISIAENGEIKVQNRGQYLSRPYIGQFRKLEAWLSKHEFAIKSFVSTGCILFGEWCAAKHSLSYDRLPDWFLLFDVYDQNSERFWSSRRRNSLADKVNFSVVPEIFKGRTRLAETERLLTRERSRLRDGILEGIVIRKEENDWLVQKAKIVKPEFTQSISEHWRDRPIEWNHLASSV